MPATTTPLISIEIDRFEKDYNRRLFFANQPAREFTRVLYVKNELLSAPTPNDSNLHLQGNNFHSEINNLSHRPTATTPNLLPSQQQALKWLLDHPELVVMSTDKNLGPAIIERERYVFYAYRDHLSDTSTYKQLTEREAKSHLSYVMSEIEAFTIKFQPSLDPEDLKYISHKTNSTQLQNEASFMYLLAKIHKQPMKTRAIISYAGSLCHGISKWLDVYLKRIVKHMPYIATSSASVVKEITSKNWPPNCKIFTCDAVSMYTHIHLKHALPVIKDFLTNTELG